MLGRLFGKRDDPASPLTRKGQLRSDLWLDQPDALDRIGEREHRGELSSEEAGKLRHFAERGYLTFEIDLPESAALSLDDSVDRLWKEKPWDVAFAYQSSLKLFPLADEARDRRPSVRIADLHSASAEAEALYLDAQVFRWVELVFGRLGVATQSLHFEYGSQQTLHRDPIHVHTSPPSHLLAAWIALEDISADCGPLTYVAGSHRLPYFEFEPGDHRFDHGRHTPGELAASLAFDLEQCAKRGLEAEPFLCRRGGVLLWHHSLLHGGSTPRDPAQTRKSFVVHFSTLGNYQRARQTALEPGPNGELKSRSFGTDRLLERAGARGFDNPIRGYAGPGSR
ncbi:MAG TPA: phytanoyl-CoA dioxygenase family protein [Thermoanaerobaculia bacterium]|nr:phytanoyl-CoA dioxygenase family protein [Thermoanaerobaculia bacterium]